jgi:S-adenosylmethionine/arginine decarboxylase-like enzyme
MARHIHLLVKAEVRRPLLTCFAAKEFLREAVRLVGMNIISGPDAVYGAIPGNEGVSATAVLDYSTTTLAQSWDPALMPPSTLHEWPHRVDRPPLLQFDLYTCGKTEPTLKLFRPLFDRLEPISLSALAIDRDSMTVLRTSRWPDPILEDEHWLPNDPDDRWIPDAIR